MVHILGLFISFKIQPPFSKTYLPEYIVACHAIQGLQLSFIFVVCSMYHDKLNVI